MELERSNAGRTIGGYSSIPKSLVDVALTEILLYFLLLLLYFVVSCSSNNIAGVGAN